MTELATNVLYYGDNLDILRRSIPDASLVPHPTRHRVYSNRNDNV